MTESEIEVGLGSSSVFVTVGTTRFDSLVRAVDTKEVKEELYRRGYTHLLIQLGRGSYIPTKCTGETGSLAVDYFTFSPSIADYLRASSLVISHAGSGSIFETLRLGKPLIVVVNEDLMDNHQSELAEELAERKHLFCARPQTLYKTIVDMDLESIVPYQPGDATPVVKLINRFLGFPERMVRISNWESLPKAFRKSGLAIRLRSGFVVPNIRCTLFSGVKPIMNQFERIRSRFFSFT